jgi:aminopeptidase YwaD
MTYLKYIVVICLLLTNLFTGASQNISFVKKRVEELSSAKFAGRGYNCRGSEKTANYLVKILKKNKLLYFNNSYRQEFDANVNTFHGKTQVKLDDRKLIPGVDFVIHSSTPSVNKTFDLFYPDSVLLNDTLEFSRKLILDENIKEKVIVINYDYITDTKIETFYFFFTLLNYLNCGGFVELNSDNFIYFPDSWVNDFPKVQIKHESFDFDAKKISFKVKAKYKKNYSVDNIIAYIPGSSDECIVFIAHYDHVGKMGKKVYFPGAHDNASGVAALLDFAEYYKDVDNKYTKVFIFFAAEELGLQGSEFFVKNPIFDLNKIKLVINLDMIGTGDDGIGVVIGEVGNDKNIKYILDSINTKLEIFDEISFSENMRPNSDHYYFYEKKINSMFMFTKGENSFYHSIDDTYENLNFFAYKDLFKLITNFIDNYE